MQYHLARNGENVGKYTLDELAKMAAKNEIFPTDHIYIAEKGTWTKISDQKEILDKLFNSESILPPPPPPSVVHAKSEPITSAHINGEELIGGYPKEYWKTIFLEKTEYFLNRFKGFKTEAEAKEIEKNHKEWKDSLTSPAERAKADLKDQYELTSLTRNIRFSLPAVFLGWGYLAYRKATPWAVTFYLISLGIIYGLKQFVIHARGSATPEGYQANMLLVVLAMFVLISLVPMLFSQYFLFQNAIGKFETVEKKFQTRTDRITNLRKHGGTSIINFLIFYIISIIANSVILFD